MKTFNINTRLLQVEVAVGHPGGALRRIRGVDCPSVDAIEAMLLAHASAGIDIASSAYVSGIEAALEAIDNHESDDHGSDVQLKGLAWYRGPALGGSGTYQHPDSDGLWWWWDGDLLLVVVYTAEGPEVSLVRVSADGSHLDFLNPTTGDSDFGWTDADIAWWAKIEESLPDEP
jgi:hypothetical protein